MLTEGSGDGTDELMPGSNEAWNDLLRHQSSAFNLFSIYVNRTGVEDGTSFMNWLPEEKSRRTTISASIASFAHKSNFFTIIDAPGDSNFAGELDGAVNAADLAILLGAWGPCP